uniref:RNA exonuclease 1 homolog n=1 Tax=Jaculus jaculus TaxID=51337 RepID=UPI001E1B2A9D|nr:RNA exonuclease 1 homolog [Jaculus jaculus]
MAMSWFPQAYQGVRKALVQHPIPDLLLPCYQQDGLLGPPPATTCLLSPEPFVFLQVVKSLGPSQGLSFAATWTWATTDSNGRRRPAGLRQPPRPRAHFQMPSPGHSPTTSAAGEKRRIAHVPRPDTGAKRTLTTSGAGDGGGSPKSGRGRGKDQQHPSPGTSGTMTCKTPSAPKEQTVPSVVASVSTGTCKKPTPTATSELKAKVPAFIRQRYLGLFVEECLQFSSSRGEAVEKAQAEERMAYDRSPNKSIYVKAVVETLGKLKGFTPSVVPGLNKATLYSRLQGYVLTEDQLKEHGYPFEHPRQRGDAVLFQSRSRCSPSSSSRTCCRCGAQYPVSSSGHCLSTEPCVYHWGKLFTHAVLGGWKKQYTCCSAPVGVSGCQVARQHVQDGRKDDLRGFVATSGRRSREPRELAHAGIYALDCEMSYTTVGLELTRVTVVDTELRVLYDTFVRPDNDIVDYNTKFSGVTEADLALTETRLRDVQAALLSLFSADTILIGHSLESDLLALKLIHRRVVDTAVLFPHRRGLPYKRSLRSLISQFLGQEIQASGAGHDPSEDAGACMRLVMWKILEDSKSGGPGDCSPPSPALPREPSG